MIYPLVRDLAAPDAPVRVPVAVTCRVLGFSTQAFYQWKRDPVSRRDWDDARLTNAAVDLHADDPEFGYRLIADELIAAGHQVSENRVHRLCTQQRLWSAHVKKRGRNRRPGPPRHDDLIGRDFTAPAVDVKWLTAITEHPTGEGELYLCAVKDCASNRIVGYSMADRMTSDLAVAALHNATARRSPQGHHRALRPGAASSGPASTSPRSGPAGLTGSMGRVGACGDNAAMESFFALLQKNVLDRHQWNTRDQLRLAIVTWIEKTYHRRRRQRALGRLTPIEFETTHTAAHAA